MKKAIAIILAAVLLCSVCGCSRQNKTFLPGAEDFLSVNTITGLLNRYQSVSCFEKRINTLDGNDQTCSWQYHQETEGSVSQVIDGDNITLYYNRFLITSPDNGRTVSYGVYLNQTNQPESLYFERENLFGQDDGAQVDFLDQQTETFRFTSSWTLDESMMEEYRYWDAAVGDKVSGIYTVAKDDLRVLKSEVFLTHNGEEKQIIVSSWTYLKPLQLHKVWDGYRNSEDRRLITILYEDGAERRYFFPTGSVPELYADDGHQIFMDEEGTVPYVAEPISESFTVYYK